MKLARVLAPSLVVIALLGAACSSGGSDAADDPTTTASATSTPEDGSGGEAPAYEERGPYEVGTRTIALADGRRVVVWYPADDSAADQPTNSFDIVSLLSPQLQSQLPEDFERPTYEIDAHTGAEPSADGPFPVVLYSHGFIGFPELAANLVSHLASWGFVVVTPTHVERSLDGLLGTAGQGVEPLSNTEVLAQSLDATLADADDDASPLSGLIDPEQVAVTGESAGASAAYRFASDDDRVDAFIAYSLGTGRPDDSGKVPEVPVPDVPGMVMAGEIDATIPADVTRGIFDEMNTPKYYVELGNAGHTAFTDACLIGKEQGGLVAIAQAAGLDIPEDMLRLADDGCQEGALEPVEGFAVINHFSVAFLRAYLGVGPEPVGLDESVAGEFDGAEVTFIAEPA